MKELAGLFEAIYGRFVLRDAFGKIVPGATLLVALYVAFMRPGTAPADAVRLVTLARIPTWMVLGALGWIAAFAIQRVGEIIFLRYYGRWIPDDKSWYREVIRFADVASPDEKGTFERYVVIKETCGNAATSLVLSGAVLFIPWHAWPSMGVPLALLAGGVLLGLMHSVQVKRNTWWLESVLDFRDGPEKGSPYRPPAANA